MKKLFPIIIALGIFALAYQVVVNFFINSHEINYSIKATNNSFVIDEKYRRVNGQDNYYFYVTDNRNDKYIFNFNEDYNKQKQILKDIKFYNPYDDLKCIAPIYKGDKVGGIVCNYKKDVVEYSYLANNKIEVKEFVESLERLGATRLDWKNNKVTSDNKMTNTSIFNVYKNNLVDNYTFMAWNYNGLFFMRKDKIVEKNYFNSDLYENTNSYLSGKYYYVFDFDKKIGKLNEITYINVEDFGKNVMSFPESLDDNMYINGSYKNNLYLTDLASKKQYVLNPYKDKAEVCGNKDDGYLILEDGNLKNISSKEYFKKKYYFDKSIKVDSLEKKFGNVNIFESDNYYYFKDQVNTFYKVDKSHLEIPVKLFKLDSVSDYLIRDDDILLISNDTMYFYSNNTGLIPIVRNNEFKYNYKNICNFYKKS